MASYNVLNAYDATARIPQFLGLLQYGNEGTVNPCYAREVRNMMTPGGVLQPTAQSQKLPAELASPIKTLARFYRRWYSDDKEVLVAASGGQLYWMVPGADTWTLLEHPTGGSYERDEWSTVTYEINEEGQDPVDILLLSNAKDGMVLVRGDTMTVEAVETPYRFGVIARYAERIWGGAAEDEPDMLAYSAPFDPTNWEANKEIPEDGAGDIRQPSWDGDSFTHIVQFGAQLICFKQNRIWRVLGTDPGEYTFKEQYGGGANYPDTVTVNGEYILMLGDKGVLRYDGLNASPFNQDFAQDVWYRMNREALNSACGCLHNGVYYLAIPVDGSAHNNAVVVYNTQENTWLMRDDIEVESWLSTDDALYYTSSVAPGRIFRYMADGWREGGKASPNARWVGQWNDLNYRDYQKGGFVVYLTAEAKAQTNISVSIQTEKKIKTKTYTIVPPVDGKEAKQKRMFFGGRGRRFRVIISSDTDTMWRLIGGIQIVAEIDGD